MVTCFTCWKQETFKMELGFQAKILMEMPLLVCYVTSRLRRTSAGGRT
ncbi:hypothetical protein OIU79_012420 [Salix purpurea]|uniref:Uncharacterized protein n=1 Tax=Salix purpurea TaxID=77065 RepID=A0A9Q0T3G1_SALPP|nr:hypothetical protein OIU79_012420 [Salix purpurea]